MKRSFALWSLFGFAFTALGGTLLHFLYDWTGQSQFAAPFSGVNESTWEHMKLLFVPLFVFALMQRFLFPKLPYFWRVKAIGTLAGLLLIPTLFYTANGIFGKTPDWFNIGIFFLSAFAAFWLEFRLFVRYENAASSVKAEGQGTRFLEGLFLFFFLLLAAAFVGFTDSPPTLPLFQDPVTGGYGIL